MANIGLDKVARNNLHTFKRVNRYEKFDYVILGKVMEDCNGH
jgi:hypothetical protein